jgi:uncharacterized protein YdaU (DUF1376 family)
MDQYYRTGEPLPADRETLFRICRGSGVGERKALERVLNEFFERRDEHLHNVRADEELARAQEIHEKRVKGGLARAHAQHMLSTCSESATANGQVRARALQSQSHIPDATHLAEPVEIWKAVWDSGRTYLTANGHTEQAARQVLMRWRQNYHETDILRALKTAQSNAVELPIPYIEKMLNGKGKANGISGQPGAVARIAAKVAAARQEQERSRDIRET